MKNCMHIYWEIVKSQNQIIIMVHKFIIPRAIHIICNWTSTLLLGKGDICS